MKMNELGRSGIMISDLCLGTMTYGTQTDQADGFAQMDMAVDAGINIFDTAEMYPVNPITAETQGDSERMVGEWFQASGKRNCAHRWGKPLIIHAGLDDLKDLELAGGEAVFACCLIGEFSDFGAGGWFFAHGYRVTHWQKKIKHMFENNLPMSVAWGLIGFVRTTVRIPSPR